MINEIVPRDGLIERGFEIADHVMKQHRVTRRMTSQIVCRPWKKRLIDDLDGGFGMQMMAHMQKSASEYGRPFIADTVECVRQGRKNKFDK